MIEIYIERRQSKKLFWCQSCGSKQSRTIIISNNDVQSSSFRLCDDCEKNTGRKAVLGNGSYGG